MRNLIKNNSIKHNSIKASLLFALMAVMPLANAQVLKPGLWKSTAYLPVTKEMQNANMKKDLANLPPDLQKQMGEMFANISKGEIVNNFCLTPEMAAKWSLPVQTENKGKCTMTQRSNLAGTIMFSISCKEPATSGEMEIKLNGDTGYVYKQTIHANASTGNKPWNITGKGEWLNSICGKVLPVKQ